jgi:hypothetical protein
MLHLYSPTFVLIALLLLASPLASAAQNNEASSLLRIPRTDDFEIDGEGSADNWDLAEWTTILQRSRMDVPLDTRIKALYSDTGIYFLFHCEDEEISSTMREDFMDLWTEDVVEVFLWPKESFPVYFEYELSPMNYELPILVPNDDGRFLGWKPWNYEGDRKTRHATSVQGGAKENGAEIDSWRAEFFIPYALLEPLAVPPSSGTTWRANFYRVDYDREESANWEWQSVDETFHEYEKFGTIRFE